MKESWVSFDVDAVPHVLLSNGVWKDSRTYYFQSVLKDINKYGCIYEIVSMDDRICHSLHKSLFWDFKYWRCVYIPVLLKTPKVSPYETDTVLELFYKSPFYRLTIVIFI